MSNKTEKISKKIYWLVKNSIHKKYKKYFLHNPFFGKIEKDYLNNCIDTTFVSTAGKYIALFENSLKKIIKSKNIIAVVNGTVALKICLEVLGIKRGYEVLVPSLTFVGTVNSIKHAGAIPHFVDSDIENFGIDNKKLEKYLKSSTIKKNGILINKKTKRRIFAIIPVHIFGNIGEIIELKKICRNYNLKIIEDAAESLGSFFQNKHAGNFGDLGILSFNANKTITTGSGGAIICNSNKLDGIIK
jgi:perosamine synthetase